MKRPFCGMCLKMKDSLLEEPWCADCQHAYGHGRAAERAHIIAALRERFPAGKLAVCQEIAAWLEKRGDHKGTNGGGT